jgi:hypothetical protein
VSVGWRLRLHTYGEHHTLGPRCWQEKEIVSSIAKWLLLLLCGGHCSILACFVTLVTGG